jgi:GT2 family glycosyltransferase
VTRPVHVVVVAYHGEALLDRCLAGLGGRLPVTVVDNSSSPDVRAVVARHRAAYVDPGTNLGFAAGVNVALRRLLDGEPLDVLLLNPDARITPEQVDALSAYLHADSHADLAAVAPRVAGSGGSEQRVLWPFPSPLRAWWDAFGLGRLPVRGPMFAIGAVLLLRWEAARDVGLFDERFFLYAEEADWQRRAVRRGWRSGVCAGAVATHDGGASSCDDVRRESLFHAAHEEYIRKWHGNAGWLVFRGGVIVGGFVRALVLRGDRRLEAVRRTALYVHGPQRSALAVRR